MNTNEKPKQETIEEAALKWFINANKREIIFDLGWVKIFEAGAKHQAERMYELMDAYIYDVMGGCNLKAKEWFNQNKK